MEDQQNKTENPKNANTGTTFAVTAILIIIGIGVAWKIGLFGSNASPKPATQSAMQNESVPPSSAPVQMEVTGASGAEAAADNEKVIKMDAGAFYYNPKTLTVKKGTKVTIDLVMKDMMHDFNIDELNVHSATAKAGETVRVSFVADKIGSFEYYCSVGQHRKNGQVGTLTVEE